MIGKLRVLIPRLITALMLVRVFCSSACGQEAIPKEAENGEFFEKQIRPLLIEKCLSCHDEKKHESGLRMTSRDALLKGGDTGPAIVPGKLDESLIIRAVEYLDDLKMPPKQKLGDTDIAKLKRWVSLGAPWPATSPPPNPVSDSAERNEFRVTSKQQNWWAFQPVKDSTPPAMKNSAWPRNVIDQFIGAELDAHAMLPAPVADRRIWLRRATFDLTGLPPTPEESAAFIADNSELAYEVVVERLLASPAYGQRWARHWLDLVRYADYHDGDAKARDVTCEPLQAWRYRDWIVDSFNRDLPFDQFIVHQIAGDLLPSPEGRDFYADGLVATTFLSNGAWDRGDADKEKMVSDMVDDNIDTIGKAFLGLTLGCARCHDHKFDPLSQRDYYALAGVFYSTRILKELGAKGGNYTLNRVPLVDKASVTQRAEQVRQVNELEAKVKELDKTLPKPPDNDPSRLALIAQRDKLKGEMLPEPPLAEAASEGGTPGGLFPGIQDVPIHVRGSYARLGPVVPRGMPGFFAGERQMPISSGSGRREVAAWVASQANPLTARVIVNRVWQWHFGEGLVHTPNNLGLLSEPPSHPALLDWLAARFVQDGWSLKKLHKRIMLSATYQQGSTVRRELVEKDPENRWLGRFAVRRLEAEAIRDAMLFTSGRLDPQPVGPAQADLAAACRSLYIQTARWDRSNYASLFDAANPDASVEARSVSTVAPQALFLLNNSVLLEQARNLAGRVIRDVPGDAPDVENARIQRVYRLLFCRVPGDEELAIARQIIAQRDPSKQDSGWVDLAHVLLCSNEFVYID
ncbi:MAG: hypothetical protein JWM11_338 [Planctomycetaceae bacterium]|nr:hypothetical protein [Planctomycetaceae bacterium]